MVDMRKKPFQAAADSVMEFEACYPPVAKGLRRLRKELTSGHAALDQRFVLTSLLRLHLDQPLWRFKCSVEKSPTCASILEGFVPSKLFSSVRKNPEESPDCHSRRAIEHWDFVLRKFDYESNDEAIDSQLTAAEYVRCMDTISSLRELMHTLRFLGSTIGTGNYCELCWRPTMEWETGGKRVRGASSRFCKVHQPSDPTSRYRTDIRYRSAFNRELRALYFPALSAYAFQLPTVLNSSGVELRRRAYDQVHSGLERKRSYKGPYGARDMALALSLEGLNQSEIARRMGISRQAVSKALKPVKHVLAAKASRAVSECTS